jgi:hypothetical protein
MLRLTVFGFVLGLAAVTGRVQPLRAQVHGLVVTSDGRPVASAVVEMWGNGEVSGRAITPLSGEFAFSAAEAGGATSITVRRVGFRPARRDVAGQASIRIVLDEATQHLPEVVVRSGSGCPNREDPRARALWTQVRHRYRQPDLDLGGEGVTFFGAVRADELGAPPTRNPWQLWMNSANSHRAQLRERIAREGYARPFSGIEMMGARQFWEYVELDAVYPQHFSDALFGELHSFSIHESDTAQTVIQFCPARRRRPHIMGTLTSDAAGNLREVAWSYVTPRSVERAGGMVAFAPGRDQGQVLYPQTSVYWRTTVNGDYYQRWTEFTSWSVEPPE